MTNEEASLPLPESAPIFPLPNMVFFPHTVLPLHIFEDRYRAMTAKALEGDRFITMTLQRPEEGKAEPGEKSYHGIGCIGRITEATQTEDGRYYLKLYGLRKVALGETVKEIPYITAKINAIKERLPEEGESGSHEELLRLLGTCTILLQEVSDTTFPVVSLKEGLPYESVVNSVCFHLGLPSGMKQELLEENDVRTRCRSLTEYIGNHLQAVLLSKEEGPDDSDNSPVN